MTEEEWLGAIEPYNLVTSAFLHKWTHPRAPRLLACAACRLAWNRFTDTRSQDAIEVAEQYADGKVTLKALAAAHKAARTAYQEARPRTTDRWLCSTAADTARPRNVISAMESVVMTISGSDQATLNDVVLSMIHDVFHRRMFRPITFLPEWRTSTVLALAQGIYDERAFDSMPILADALQDAGCSNEDILNHCRSETVHTRGCWVIDLLTGRV